MNDLCAWPIEVRMLGDKYSYAIHKNFKFVANAIKPF